jgi:hypothetical protein
VIRMLVTKTSFVIPKQLMWAALLLQIGFFGFCAQVRSPDHAADI